MAQNQALSEAVECKQTVALLLGLIKLKIQNASEENFDDVKNHDWFKLDTSPEDNQLLSYFSEIDKLKIAAAMNVYLVEDRLNTYYKCIKGFVELKKMPGKDCTQDEEKFYKDFKRLLPMILKEPYSYLANGLEKGLKYALASCIIFVPLCFVLGPAALIGVGAAFVLGIIKGVYDNYKNLQELSEPARNYLKR
jgi:hypothetical protein